VSDALRTRLARRARRDPVRALVRVFGRELVCADCGRVILRAIPVPWRGRVRLVGAREHNVRVAFASKEHLEFRHVELDRCPSPERPWVS
jgi:hypothetical protein